MESQNDLNDKIRLTTIKIQEEHPELIKYINEIPRNFLSNSEKGINNKELKGYLDSLNNLLETYAKKH
ncbi:hypothetical protein BTO04_01055 [Polaribacter sp. SA4-10]|uniref:hypothetical protein n=1 Tax=Polaribacter sp. SA4-10 TaxID=754397 RepID=UPI000B3C84B1|nr:hypothetical protein [Polaribacter sp. SA4-10]ARV05364.1 hypothetical protein BTO04_01055 [Polaribacter sp. SA4-10]